MLPCDCVVELTVNYANFFAGFTFCRISTKVNGAAEGSWSGIIPEGEESLRRILEVLLIVNYFNLLLKMRNTIIMWKLEKVYFQYLILLCHADSLIFSPFSIIFFIWMW